MKRLVPLVLLLAILGYLGGYAAARAGGWIVHASNHGHWIPEKRSSEHRVGSDHYTNLYERALNLFFKPLRVLEEKYHGAANGTS